MVGLAHLLLFIWPPSVWNTWLDKSVYFLLGETVQKCTCGHNWFTQKSAQIESNIKEAVHLNLQWKIEIFVVFYLTYTQGQFFGVNFCTLD